MRLAELYMIREEDDGELEIVHPETQPKDEPRDSHERRLAAERDALELVKTKSPRDLSQFEHWLKQNWEGIVQHSSGLDVDWMEDQQAIYARDASLAVVRRSNLTGDEPTPEIKAGDREFEYQAKPEIDPTDQVPYTDGEPKQWRQNFPKEQSSWKFEEVRARLERDFPTSSKKFEHQLYLLVHDSKITSLDDKCDDLQQEIYKLNIACDRASDKGDHESASGYASQAGDLQDQLTHAQDKHQALVDAALEKARQYGLALLKEPDASAGKRPIELESVFKFRSRS